MQQRKLYQETSILTVGDVSSGGDIVSGFECMVAGIFEYSLVPTVDLASSERVSGDLSSVIVHTTC